MRIRSRIKVLFGLCPVPGCRRRTSKAYSASQGRRKITHTYKCTAGHTTKIGHNGD